MQAIWYERFGPASDVLMIGPMDDPEPAEGEVLVRIPKQSYTKLESQWWE